MSLEYWNLERYSDLSESLVGVLGEGWNAAREVYREDQDELRARLDLTERFRGWIAENGALVSDELAAALVLRTFRILSSADYESPEHDGVLQVLLSSLPEHMGHDTHLHECDREMYLHLIEAKSDEDRAGNVIEPIMHADDLLDPRDTPINLSGASVCITGSLAFGTREAAAAAIAVAGGSWQEYPNENTDILLIGCTAVLADGRIFLSEKVRGAIAQRSLRRRLRILHEVAILPHLNAAAQSA